MTNDGRMTETALDEAFKLDLQLCFAVYATAHAFTRTYKPLLEPLGLTYPQYLVMMVLWEKGEIPVKTIGQALDLDSGTLSPLLKRLEQAGHLQRIRDPQDERQVLVRLTDQGTALRGRATGVMVSIGAAVGYSLDEMGALRDRLQQLRHQLNRAEGGADAS